MPVSRHKRAQQRVQNRRSRARCLPRETFRTLRTGFALARICTDSGFSDQEDQLGARGLVMNAIILWNTLDMDRALAALRQAGVAVQPEDVTRLSPLGFKHVNLIGRYQFAL